MNYRTNRKENNTDMSELIERKRQLNILTNCLICMVLVILAKKKIV